VKRLAVAIATAVLLGSACAGNLENANLNVFVSASTGDLHLNAGSAPLGQGGAGSGVAEDLDGQARPTTAPDVGADEVP
jgi:hypothetical protein